MIKRMNKLTSLLVAATAVVSIVPATVANAATTNLETKEGTIESAQAFNDGKYVFDGYKGDDQDAGLYYSNGTTDTEIDDVDGTGVRYGASYIDYSSDDVLFNLKNGQAEADTAADKQSYIETKFKTSVVKKADRYNNAQTLATGTQLSQDKFGDVWYQYSVQSDDQLKNYTVFVGDAGKYVDASETLNITYYKADGTKIKLDTVSDLAKNTLTMTEGAVIATDADYIYRTVEITDGTTPVTFLQKISKAQGDTKDGAYLPKSVNSYEIATADLAALTPGTVGNVTTTFRVLNNSVYSIQTNPTDKEITINKYDLKKVKDDVTLSNGNAATLDKYKAELDEDYDNIDKEDMTAFDIDVDGNVWVLYKGEIEEVVNGKLETKYTVDRTMDNLSVYDENDIVTWSSANDIYSTVAGQTETPVVETPATPVVTAGWVKNADGTWSFNKADGSKATGWVQDGAWYFLNANGIMQTGWVKDGSAWYFLTGSGAMKTGWVNDNGTWYFLQSSGAMKTGWLNDNGTWYYLNASGAMLANTTVDGYKLAANGAWVK
ncbi:N-acetylmuramoyl-L-alanine amidase family protein [Clostridium sp.]|uniref:N-acetylmuramoyl-L-alanine amidase family protein n=1 Tax=Clostridium sp. TaxID=1506 RepID=UPI0025C2F445|nr:N-acetylmuramoyl-L-alanine amidase family protein [Clostridium sp.]